MNTEENSRRTFTAEDTYQSIQIGCLQRIAKATEAMAKSHVALQSDLNAAVAGRKYWMDTAEKRWRSNVSLRGQVTKLKNKLRALGDKSNE